MNRYWKRNTALLAVLLLAAVAVGCSVLAPAPTPSPAPTAVPTATPAPVVTYGAPAVLPETGDVEIPAGYTRVVGDAAPENVALYTFLDASGSAVYRVFGGYDVLTDGVLTDTVTGFYAADETGALVGAEPVDAASEPFGQCTPAAIPETIRMKNAYQATGAEGCYASSDPAHPGSVVYGTFSADGEGAFYPADADGNMVPGALPVDYTVSVPAYTPADDPTAADGARRLVVYIGTETVVAYKANGGCWEPERIMICSTGRRKDMTPRGEFAIMRQYLYKKMGEVQGENVYSQYASRITGSYLFHSVPIGGKNRFKPEYGKKQMFVDYYEKLGTVASGGCVRLRCIDAYWIYMNCEVGTPVTVTDDSGPEAPEIPALIYEEPYMDKRHDYGWDPSDPDPENPYHAVYTPEVVLTGEVIDKHHTDTSNGAEADDEAETGETS